jgi:hypothetical protein
MLGRRLAGYESAQSRQLFRHFLNTPAEVEITAQRVEVTLPKRAHNPLLLAAGLGQGSTPIPWWDGRPLALRFRQNNPKYVSSLTATKIQASVRLFEPPGDDVLDGVQNLIPGSAKCLRGFFPRKAARPAGQEQHVGLGQTDLLQLATSSRRNLLIPQEAMSANAKS